MTPRRSKHLPGRPRARRAAFTLVEMIAVTAIIIIMLGLLGPAISSMSNSAGRKSAVNMLMNTFEQARVAALESGRTVYVVFHRRIFPEPDAILVLREPDPATASPYYEQLTKWIPLPTGVLLHEIGGNNILSEPMPAPGPDMTFDKSKSPTKLINANGESLNILAFNPYGGVSFPSAKKLMLIVSEGVRGQGGTEALISNKKAQAGGFEIITLRRYTGRASLEVTTL